MEYSSTWQRTQHAIFALSIFARRTSSLPSSNLYAIPRDQYNIWGGLSVGYAPENASSALHAAPIVILNMANPEEESEPSLFDHDPPGYDGTEAWKQEEERENQGHENSDDDETCFEKDTVCPPDSVLPSCLDAAVVGGALAGQRMTASTQNARAAFSSAPPQAADKSTVPTEKLPKGGFNHEMTVVMLDSWSERENVVSADQEGAL
jgi:hypothetical protein